MDVENLYDEIAKRKDKPKDYLPYDGSNGRVNKCAQLVRAGKLKNSGTLLDVGGGIGDLGDSLKDYFDDRIVVDICKISLKAAAAKNNLVFNLNTDKVGLKGIEDNSVDLVTALDFIEHIIDPEFFARECFRTLKPGGHVFINTPNIRYFEHLQNLIMQGYFPHTSGDKEVFHGGHVAFFTRLDLQMIFQKAGFTSFETFKDEECFKQPPDFWINLLHPRNQQQYIEAALDLGCPNLLFKCEKPL